MDKNTKVKILAGVAAALILAVGVGAAGAVAASRALSGSEHSQAVIDDAAEQLGIESSELSDALKQALKNRVDEAVEEGRLTEEEGKRLEERIDSEDTPLLFGGFGPHRHFGHLGHFGGLDAAATYLGLTQAELREQLRDGNTLADVAEDEGKPVAGLVDAMVADAEERIDEAVADGRLDEERATDLKQRLEERITDLVEGELRTPRLDGRRFGGPHGFHLGPRGPRS